MAHECPVCGREFETQRGLGVHHSRAHGKLLPNRTCENCGDEFHSPHERAYCSDHCLRSATSSAGSENPNYSDASETTRCRLCDTEFRYYPSEKEGLFCPECIESESWRDPPEATGSDNPQWSGGRVELECAACDATVQRYPSAVSADAVVCSEECRRERLSERFTGPDHPNWEGGGDLNYGAGWAEVRRAALERDAHECVVCSKTKAEIGRNPDVHHIVPVRYFVETDGVDRTASHRLDNVISLCAPCHRRAEAGRISRPRLRDLIQLRAHTPVFRRGSSGQ